MDRCILRIHGILNMTLGLQYTKILNVSGVLVHYSFKGYINRVLNIPRVPNVLKF